MPTFSTAQRLKIALGGFLSFTGFLIVISTILTATGTVHFESVFQNELFIPIVAAMGALAVVCGLLLVFRNKMALRSFAAHQEKPSNNAD